MFSTVKRMAGYYDKGYLEDDVFSSGDNSGISCGNYFSARKAMDKKNEKIKERVGCYFIHPLHMPVFERISLEDNIAISVRESGEYTLKALEAGAAAKGHNILEKTIKPSSVEKIYRSKSVVDEVLTGAQKCDFLGRVGHWSDSGIRGIYARHSIDDSDVTCDVNLNSPMDNELLNAWVARKIITPYTGDYDLHDIILFKDGKGMVPEPEGPDEKGIKDKINRYVSEVDSARPFENISMNVVRHGPQVNYVPYMWKCEREKVISDKGYHAVVAKPGPFPIAMVYKGLWHIFESQQELFTFYDENKTPLPTHWANELIDCGGGFVVTHEHKKMLDEYNGQANPKTFS